MLSRLRIRAKLTLVAAVPLLCLVALVIAGSVVQARAAVRAGQLADEVRLSVVITNLVHELQRERGLSSGLVGGGHKAEDRKRVDEQRAAVDAARTMLVAASERFGQNPAGRAVQAANTRVRSIDDHRAAVDARGLDVAGTLRWYTDTIMQYLDVTTSLGRSATATDLLSQLTAYGALSRAKEAAALERGMMNGVFGQGSFAGEQYSQFLTLVATQRAERDVFDNDATDAQRTALASALLGPEISRAAEIERTAMARPTGALGIRPVEWWDLMTVRIDRYRSVEQRLAADVVEAADAQAAAARSQLIGFVGAGLLLVVLSGVIVVLTARTLSRPMRRLTERAFRSARDDLPRVIGALQDLSGDAVAPGLPPIEVTTEDEVAELAAAFNSIQQAAIDLAVEQAMLRRNVAEMFVNLGRRNQTLIGRQLAFIDRLERDEADPHQLDKLFRLDHMTTRMRRNAESLLVLAGAELPRRWAGAVPVTDLVRAGLSEIEDYARVDLSDLGDTAVAGATATDVTHLLAELLENATTFSPPSSRIEVHGTRRTDGYLLAIVDHGIGMSEAQLADANARIDELARFDRAPSKLLGLYVVGRLAARHAIRVRLVESVTSGVTAKVLLPVALLEDAPPTPEPAPMALTEAPALVGAVVGAAAPGPGSVAVASPPLQRRGRSLAVVERAEAVGPGVPAPSPVPVAPIPAPGGRPLLAQGGEHSLRQLRRRVRGAQLPDTGRTPQDRPSVPVTRSANDVGASLAAFQAAVDRGRQAAPERRDPFPGPNRGE